jgi:hypothetical protein
MQQSLLHFGSKINEGVFSIGFFILVGLQGKCGKLSSIKALKEPFHSLSVPSSIHNTST